MPGKVEIVTNGHTTYVDKERNLAVSPAVVPPASQPSWPIIYRHFLLNSSGSSDMRVNGSVTPVEFFINPPQDSDLYITQLVFTIADAGMELNEFGNIPALTNGLSVENSQDTGNLVVAQNLRTNFDVARLCITSRAFGSQANAFIANNVIGSSEGLCVNLDFREVFGLVWGLRMEAATNQQLSVTVRDNLTALDQFDVLAYGYTRPL